MIYNVNPPASRIRYVSNLGINSLTCGQTISAPCLDVSAAINSVAVSNNVDGVEIRLLNGRYILPEYSGSATTTTRWLTITSAENANPDNVIVDGFASYTGLGLEPINHVRIFNVALVRALRANGNFGQYNYVWMDRVKAYYESPTAVTTGNCFGLGHWPGSFYTIIRTYMTDVTIDNSCWAAYGNVLVRDVFADYTGWGWGGSHTTIRYFIRDTNSISPTVTDYHGDIFAFQEGDVIIYGGGTVPGGNPQTRGAAEITTTNALDLNNIVFDGVNINMPNAWVFSFCNRIYHIIIKDSTFIGSSGWCVESPVETFDISLMRDVLIQDSTFINPGGSIIGPLTDTTLLPIPNTPGTITYATTPLPNPIILNANSCSETDGGFNYQNSGGIGGSFWWPSGSTTGTYVGTFTDVCVSNNVLLEGVCGSSISSAYSSLVGVVYVNCAGLSPNGQCVAGRCI